MFLPAHHPPTPSPVTSTVPVTDEVQIRELVTGQRAAMRARDAEWLVSRYAPEAVTCTLAPPLRNADVLDADWLRTWFSGFAGPIDFEVRDLTVTAGEDVAFCYSLNRLSATPQGSPEGFDLWFRATVGLRKVDGAWRITHEHTSTPFYMDGTFASAVDLTP